MSMPIVYAEAERTKKVKAIRMLDGDNGYGTDMRMIVTVGTATTKFDIKYYDCATDWEAEAGMFLNSWQAKRLVEFLVRHNS